jgi:predicted DsbA family dithiol-disulfide isomerase
MKFLQTKIGIFFFISAAIAALFIYVLLNSLDIAGNKASKQDDKYYLNKDFKENDELLTRVPNLSDMLAGPIISWNDPSQGDKYAKVIIVEYSDFKCDYCQRQEQNIKKVLADYRDYVRIVWKDYPENDSGSESYQAAVAGRCANEQGRFWEYHDFLYEYNDDFDQDSFVRLAELADLNIKDFKDCLENDEEVIAQINDNIKEANALGITGIPFIYVNDQELMGEATYEDLEQLVEVEMGR